MNTSAHNSETNSERKRLERVREEIKRDVIAAEIFEPNFSYLGYSTLTSPINWYLERRAIKRGGIAPYTFWVIDEDKVYVYRARLTLKGWKPKQQVSAWLLRDVIARRVQPKMQPDLDYAFEISTPDGRYEVQAAAYTQQAKEVIALLCDKADEYGDTRKSHSGDLLTVPGDGDHLRFGEAWRYRKGQLGRFTFGFASFCVFVVWGLSLNPSLTTWILGLIGIAVQGCLLSALALNAKGKSGTRKGFLLSRAFEVNVAGWYVVMGAWLLLSN